MDFDFTFVTSYKLGTCSEKLKRDINLNSLMNDIEYFIFKEK